MQPLSFLLHFLPICIARGMPITSQIEKPMSRAGLQFARAICTICNMHKPSVRVITEADIPELQSWLDQMPPGHVDVDLKALPPNGLIVPGVLAMFWTMTDSPIMYCDTVVGNPSVERQVRREAGMVLAAMLVQVARAHKIRRILFLTRNKGVHEFYSKLLCAKSLGEFTLYRSDIDLMYPEDYSE